MPLKVDRLPSGVFRGSRQAPPSPTPAWKNIGTGLRLMNCSSAFPRLVRGQASWPRDLREEGAPPPDLAHWKPREATPRTRWTLQADVLRNGGRVWPSNSAAGGVTRGGWSDCQIITGFACCSRGRGRSGIYVYVVVLSLVLF